VADHDTNQAERDAAMAAAFFDALVASGKSEQVAAQLTSAYILGRLRRGSREPWDLADEDA
jgi:hypothetical protein